MIGRPCIVCNRRTENRNGRCDDHQISEAERLAAQPYRREYTSSEYRRNRPLAFKRSGGYCENPGCTNPLISGEWECDHIVPVRFGGSSALHNLACLCRPCYLVKNAADHARRNL